MKIYYIILTHVGGGVWVISKGPYTQLQNYVYPALFHSFRSIHQAWVSAFTSASSQPSVLPRRSKLSSTNVFNVDFRT